LVHVEMLAKVRGRLAAEIYPILCDFSTYASCVDAVRTISVEQLDGRFTSNWEVDFHGGIMRWKEEDIFLREQHAIQFRQLEGDVDHFSGEWRITNQDGGCRIEFRADFDLGVAGLSEVLDPIADAALRENVRGIIVGLLGEVEFE